MAEAKKKLALLLEEGIRRRHLQELLLDKVLQYVSQLRLNRVLCPGHIHLSPSRKRRIEIPPWLKDHRHPHLEICFLLEGRALVGFWDKAYRILPGDLIIFSQFVEHWEAPEKEEYRMFLLGFASTATGIHVSRGAPGEGVRVTDRVLFSPGSLLALGTQVEEMVPHLSGETLPEFKLRLARLIVAACSLLGSAPFGNLGYSPAVAKAVELMTMFPTGGLAVWEIASLVGVSADHLNRLFKRETGMRVKTFQKELQWQVVLGLIDAGMRSSREIAQTAGFSDPHYFQKVFRKRTGLTLGEFFSTSKRKAADKRRKKSS